MAEPLTVTVTFSQATSDYLRMCAEGWKETPEAIVLTFVDNQIANDHSLEGDKWVPIAEAGTEGAG